MTMTFDRVHAVHNLLADVALSLDREAWDAFLGCCSDDFHYQVTAFSPDLGTDMVWLDHVVTELKEMFSMIPRHVRMRGGLRRHVSQARITPADGNTVEATSTLLLVHTAESGETKVIASGLYIDRIGFDEGETPRLASRHVALDTIIWNPGLHVPV
ncbi:nuclear transport factor 2 family protein [Roseovarius autotrophicus]|uniref:nuclear transport factor 2 family protein n=1 Tax=Roseovarius autotrophicus TaxID=2824121 RepID=UPI001B36E063|nr:nuclear transport factor 2 family protein [Roseovarius autotrophicus]